jgi:N4-gp56 family major capsid protein
MMMAYTNFQPEIWSKQLLSVFDKQVVMAKLVNTDYEGDIKEAGTSVRVRSYGNVTINTYTRNQTLSFETLTDPMQTLMIDQQRYFAFRVDDLDLAQSNINLKDGYTERAAIAIRNVVDSHLFGKYTEVQTSNVQGTLAAPLTVNKNTIYNYITQMAEALDTNNVPNENRALVISPKYKTVMLQAPEFVRAGIMGDSVVQNGRVGQLAGFDVYVSTNIPVLAGGVVPMMALHPQFLSFASQVAQVEAVRPADQFSTVVRGLYLYGSKVFHPEAASLVMGVPTII